MLSDTYVIFLLYKSPIFELIKLRKFIKKNNLFAFSRVTKKSKKNDEFAKHLARSNEYIVYRNIVEKEVNEIVARYIIRKGGGVTASQS